MAERAANAQSEFFAYLAQDHGRIEARLEALARAVEPLRAAEHDPAAALESVAGTLAFFASDGARHEQLEELALFPRIRPLPEFKQILGALEFQHRMNREAEQALADCFERFDSAKSRELRRLAIRFVEMHRGHAIAEERALFPLASSALSPRALAEMNRELPKR